MANIRFCKECKLTKKNTSIPVIFFTNLNKEIVENYFAGYIYGIQDSYWDDTDKCPFCKCKTIELNIEENDAYILFKTSNGNRQLLEAMIDLKEKDIIEYELKMSQFRAQIEQKNVQVQREKDNQPKCPTCNSTNIKRISGTSKAVSVALFGLLSQKVKKQWHCNNCGSEW